MRACSSPLKHPRGRSFGPLVVLWLCPVALFLLLLQTSAEEHEQAWPRQVSVKMDGDIILGALMMVHERSGEKDICGKIMTQGGIQAVETMIYTIEEVNRQQLLGYLPHSGRALTFGALILDDCDKDTYGLQQAVQFIKGHIAQVTGGDFGYRETAKSEEKPISAVIAAASSFTTMQVASLLKLFKLPQISYFSTSADLRDRERYPYFFRTIPSDEFQVEAMVKLVEHLQWKYVSILYEESSYGKTAYDRLRKHFLALNVCVAHTDHLPKDSGFGKASEYRQIVTMLMKNSRARAVIVYGSDQEVKELMIAVRELGASTMFTWIGSDGWSARKLVTEGNEAAVHGTISVQPTASPIPGFKEYFDKLRVDHNNRNPWFYEMWEYEHKCRYADYPETPFNKDFTTPCRGNESKVYAYEKQLQFVSDAVMAYAYAFAQYLEEGCKVLIGFDEGDAKLKEDCIMAKIPRSVNDKQRTNGTKIVHILNNITFKGLAGNHFEFFENGGPPRYNLIHFTNTSDGYKWITVGNFSEHGLALDKAALNFNLKTEEGDPVQLNDAQVPESLCAHPCAVGSKKIIATTNKKCCWNCEDCRGREIAVNETACVQCPPGTVPSLQHDRCQYVPVESVEPLGIYAISCLIVAFIGVLITTTILIVFVRNNNTPIVKASGRELSYIIIIGLYLCFGMTPLMLQTPTAAICAIQRFMSGFCFTIIYAGLLTKANRIARIFRSGKRTTRRPNFISPQSQIVICCIIASVQVLIIACWLYLKHPKAVKTHPAVNRTLLVCEQAVKHSYLVSYLYPILLCIICTLYAIQTRRIPEAFNESKYIGVAVYTTCVIWLAFVPIYFVVIDNIPTRITSVCISTSLTAVVCQICLFFPKMYIIMFRPERNVRQAVLGPKSSSVSANKNNTYVTAYRSDSPSSHSDDNLLEPLNKPEEHQGSDSKAVNPETTSTGVQTSPVGTHAPLAYINSLNSEGDIQL